MERVDDREVGWVRWRGGVEVVRLNEMGIRVKKMAHWSSAAAGSSLGDQSGPKVTTGLSHVSEMLTRCTRTRSNR